MENSNDFTSMKVTDLQKELKSRGLSSIGDKARFNAAMSLSQDDHGDVTLDSDEIDSDGVLDEDDKAQNDNILDSLNEELALADHPLLPAADQASLESKTPRRTLKRKITSDAAKKGDIKTKAATAKKIVLNRPASVITSTPSVTEEESDHSSEIKKSDTISSKNKIKISADICATSKLDLRPQRIGLPATMTNAQRKEARKKRFSQNTSSVLSTEAPSKLPDNIDKLKMRAERFGQSVSKIMTDIENKEKMEKRKAKFGIK